MTTTTFEQALATNYIPVKTTSSFQKFLTWCSDQQNNRLLWLGVILAAHGCIITPMTVMTVLATGNHFVLFMISMIAMAASLVTNLAAMPTKVTIPVFFLSTLVDVAVLVACFAYGFNLASVGM